MTCAHCVGAGRFFDQRMARSELKRYRRRGPRGTTRDLVAELTRDGLGRREPASLLDIGGGVGVVQLELLAAGLDRAVSVDASPAYVEAAREEAARRGVAERIEHIEADFLEVAETVEDMDYVSLDRVVCCYPDARALVEIAASKTRRRLVLVAPRDGRVMRFGVKFPNAYLRIRGNPFRVYVHALADLDRSATASGLTRSGRSNRGLWTVLTYDRNDPN